MSQQNTQSRPVKPAKLAPLGGMDSVGNNPKLAPLVKQSQQNWKNAKPLPGKLNSKPLPKKIGTKPTKTKTPKKFNTKSAVMKSVARTMGH